MRNKIFDSFDEAVADVFDGATVAIFCWGVAGTPQNLIRALRDRGVKDLTYIGHNIAPGFVGTTLVSEDEMITPFCLIPQFKKVITAWAGTRAFGVISPLEKLVAEGKVELEVTGHGTLAERVRAGGSGIGGFYTQIGVDTILEEGKEKRVIDGKEYILEKPLRADFGFVRALKADRSGNLVYRASGRGANPLIAMASDITVAEVDEIVELGELDPEVIVTPGIFVDRIVKVPPGGLGSYEQRAQLIAKYLSPKEDKGALSSF